MGMLPAPEPMMDWMQAVRKFAVPMGRVWLFLKVLAVLIGLVSAVVVATNATRLEAIKSVSADYSQVAETQGQLFAVSEAIISEAYASERFPAQDDLQVVKERAILVLGELSAFEGPSGELREARNAYQSELEKLIGSVNSYKNTLKSYTAFQNSSVQVADRAGDLRTAVRRFTGSTWRSFISVL